MLVGRFNEIKSFENIYGSNNSEFVAVYGRRRVGKTFLIRNVFKERFIFQLTALANATLDDQLSNFNQNLQKQHPKFKFNEAKNWFEAFRLLEKVVEKSKKKKKVLFIDELPWFDTPKSKFVSALENFWNGFASARKDVLLIVCGSAASWMINKLINNRGGLHNRVTRKFKINPFTLGECKAFAKYKKIVLNEYNIAQLYMIFGGIPYYWEQLEKGKSVHQNIDDICFSENGILRTEFQNLFRSLFTKADKHLQIIEVLSKKGIGISREEILKLCKMTDGGSLTRILTELEESGFIRKYIPYGKKTRNSLFQVCDFYTLFYFKFIKNHHFLNKNFWLNAIDNPKQRAWSGFAFEQVCMSHIEQIKKAFGIQGIETKISSWRSLNQNQGTQIDLLIERRDQIIQIIEIKFSIKAFVIDKKYEQILRTKIGTFIEESKTNKAVHLGMITSYGIQKNKYSDIIQNSIKLTDLFE